MEAPTMAKTTFLKITRRVIIGGRHHEPGEIIEVGDVELARGLLSMRAAVPTGGPGRCLVSPACVREVIAK
jgi:hypothetical protein